MDAGKKINPLCPLQSSLVYMHVSQEGFSSSFFSPESYTTVYVRPRWSLLWHELIACSGRREQLWTSQGPTRCSDSVTELQLQQPGETLYWPHCRMCKNNNNPFFLFLLIYIFSFMSNPIETQHEVVTLPFAANWTWTFDKGEKIQKWP